MNLKTEQIAVAKLTPHPKNVRQGNVGAISMSLEMHGQYRPIVAQKATGYILAGNHTYKAAMSLGWKDIAVTYVDVDDDQALRILLMDNRANDIATYDEHGLSEVLSLLMDTEKQLAGTGFSPQDLDELLALVTDLTPPDLLDDPDAVPDKVPAKSVTGDVWLLGPHRLVCGDATITTDVDKLMAGKMADLLHTDPPYGVDYEGVNNDHLKAEKLRTFIKDALTNAYLVLREAANAYVWHPDIHAYEFIGAFRDSGFQQARPPTIQWVKDSLVLSQGDYHSRNEPCLYGWKPGSGRVRVTDRTQDTIWEYPKPRKADGHPTMKPIELCARAINNSSNPQDVVLDLFGGSGSTLIAAHQTNRIAYLMELDPHYVDVICARFQQLTGIKPIAEATGKEHDFLEIK